MTVRLAIALQGGGAHGAFIWGVLDRLRQKPRFEIVAISGTSAGAMNAGIPGAARVVLVCVDKPEDGTRIVELMKAEFPLVPVLARASDRRQSMDLIRAGADFHIRETFESAIVVGGKALETLSVAPAEVAEISPASAIGTASGYSSSS